jgi:hypothetical protein
MAFGPEERLAILRKRAAEYVDVSLTNIVREYPVMPIFIATGPGPYPTHRETHPAFFGCFDWHSCVELHWVTVRLLKLFPGQVPGERARATLSELLTPENLTAEVRFFSNPSQRSIERPYGWGWLLTLQHELATWDDPDGRRWADAVAPLADLLGENLIGWLPKLTYPVRTGVHPNTAFALSRSFDYATLLAERGDRRLLDTITENVRRWFLDDSDYPVRYEPSGSDFLSAGLCEAELVSLVLDRGEFGSWLTAFLPGLADSEPQSLFTPAEVSDPTDGHIAHLHGLNLSRAWAFTRLAERLPEGDPRIAPMLEAADRHATASLSQVAGSDYMVEHWLAAYATLLLS